ncbi:multidrug transporter subunit MdtN [Devosia sp.]|uniref:multidrug transporter subunit MdtN n=1 Tax=Devosia sp. TaxID=1871048 RepID=UPI001AD42489|nr:multidrug transporter subunit MdtN [Devosia sp.]MBN9332989.1 multidrug transporter subunit MdtN [Devosia sp.]
MRAVLGKIIGYAVFTGTAVMIYLAWSAGLANPRSDVAEIEAPVIQISPTVPGRVVSINVSNNDTVKSGDVLFQIDPEPYKLRLEQAQAELRATQSELAQGERNIATEQTNADVAQKQIERAKFNADLAKQTLDRLEPLLDRGFVTAQQVDQARTAYNDALVSLDQALQQSQGASTVIGTLDTRQAQVDTAMATVALAQRDLDNTTIRAPFDGIVTGLTMPAGQYVVTGQTVFTMIDTSHWEAVAFFRETELPNIAIGDEVEVFVMANAKFPVSGTVSAIGWGVRSADAATILGLPIVSNSLNWVKVAKRFPVYVELHEPPTGLMRVGASAVVVIKGTSAEAGNGGDTH